MGLEFATILTAVDSRGYCVCKVVSLGRATPDAVIDLYERHCIDAAYLCSDANGICNDACDLLDIPHYVKPSNYDTVLERAGYLYRESGKPQEERTAHNRALLERLYREGQIDYIAHREDLTYAEFDHIKRSYRLSLARVNELHSEIKLMIEKKMTNVATKYLQDYRDRPARQAQSYPGRHHPHRAFHEVIPGADKRAAGLGAAFQRVHNGVAVGVAKRSRLKLCHRGALLLSVIFKCQKIGQIF